MTFRKGAKVSGPILKPCPFCGEPPFVTEDWKNDGGFILRHDDSITGSSCILGRLGVNLAYAATLEAIGYSWNKRADDVQKPEGGKVNAGAEKPPLGVMPRRHWLRQRMVELVAAMQRYVDAGRDIPTDWVVDLQLICNAVQKPEDGT